MEGPYGVGLGRDNKPLLWISETKERPAHLHLAFSADNRMQVDAFYANYYGAFVIGPDGHNIEVVCHKPQS